MKYYLSILSLLCFKLLLAQTYTNISYTTKNGLPHNTVYSVVRDHKGFVWIATRNGLSRFDGETFTNFSIENGLPTNEVIGLNADFSDRIWITGLNGEIGFYKDGRFVNYAAVLRPHLKLKSMVRVKPLSPQLICFNEVCDVIIFDIEKQKVVYRFTNPGDFYNVLKVSDSIIINQGYELVYVINRATKKLSYATKEKMAGRHTTIYNDEILAVNENEILRYAINGKRIVLKGIYRQKENIAHIVAGQDSLLYMVSREGNLYVSDSSFQFTKCNAFTSTNIDQVYVFNDVRIASVQNGGIIVSKVNKSNVFSANTSIKCLSLDFDNNNPIIGSNSSTVYKVNEGHIQSLVLNKSGRVLKVFSINNNRYYLGDAGLILENAKGQIIYSERDELPGAFKNYCIENNSIFVAGSHGCFQADPFSLKSIKQLYNERAYAIYVSTNTTWIACVKGLLKNNRLFDLHTKNNIVPEISAIKGLNDSTIVISTFNLGVFIVQPQKVLNISTNEGLNSSFCNDVTIDKSGIWVSSNFGVNKLVATDSSMQNWRIENFSNRFGANIGEVFQTVVKNNTLFVAAEAGLYQLDLSIPENHIPIYVTHFVDSNTVTPIINNNFTTRAKNFQIPFECVKFAFANASISFRYKFESESQWHYTNIERIPLEHLKAGSYKLLIEPLINNLPIENNTAYVYLKILPTFFERTLVRVILGLLVLLFVVLITYSIVRYFAKQNEVRLQLQAQSSTLELDLTRAQMKPHFIFNSLNSIYYYVLHGDAESAQRYLLKVAKLIRKSLYLSKLPFIALEDEIDFLDNYIAIEKLRFENKFVYKITIAETVKDMQLQLPSLFLQPIIENAINHGLNYRKDGLGELLINFENVNNLLLCRISDNGIGVENSIELKKKSEKKHVSMGQNLVAQKINLIKKIYNINISVEQSYLNASDTQYPGTLVNIAFPLLKQNDIQL